MKTFIALTSSALGLLLGLALVVTPSVRAQPLEYNTNRPGSDFDSFDLQYPRPEMCRDACMNNTACQAFTYVNPGVQGPSARCWLKGAVPMARQEPCCVSGVKGAAGDLSQTFSSPRIGGMLVDRCLYWAQQCDEPAASAFCRSRGLSRAVDWAWDYTAPTRVQGSGQVCSDPSSCGGFSSITCE